MPLPVEPLIRWTLTFHEDLPRRGMQVIPGASHYDRTLWYERFLSPAWVDFRSDTIEDLLSEDTRTWTQNPFANLIQRVRKAKAPTPHLMSNFHWEWDLLWAMLSAEEFFIPPLLSRMADDKDHIVHGLHKALWTLRFGLKETNNPDLGLDCNALGQWLGCENFTNEVYARLHGLGIQKRLGRHSDILDVMFFLLTLAEANGVFTRMILGFDGLERIIQEDNRPALQTFWHMLSTLQHWVNTYRMPVGFLVGFANTPKNVAELRQYQPEFAETVLAGLDWTTR